jgi:hypothetical protein
MRPLVPQCGNTIWSRRPSIDHAVLRRIPHIVLDPAPRIEFGSSRTCAACACIFAPFGNAWASAGWRTAFAIFGDTRTSRTDTITPWPMSRTVSPSLTLSARQIPDCYRLRRRAAVELALWFNDVAYDPGAADNEDRSAATFAAAARASLSPVLTAEVRRLILATRHHRASTDTAHRVLLACDLGRWGGTPRCSSASGARLT